MNVFFSFPFSMSVFFFFLFLFFPSIPVFPHTCFLLGLWPPITSFTLPFKTERSYPAFLFPFRGKEIFSDFALIFGTVLFCFFLLTCCSFFLSLFYALLRRKAAINVMGVFRKDWPWAGCGVCAGLRGKEAEMLAHRYAGRTYLPQVRAALQIGLTQSQRVCEHTHIETDAVLTLRYTNADARMRSIKNPQVCKSITHTHTYIHSHWPAALCICLVVFFSLQWFPSQGWRKAQPQGKDGCADWQQGVWRSRSL